MSEYLFSYTSASLLVYETHIIIDEYLKLKDWDAVKRVIVEDNILQKNTVNTRKRMYIELKRRIDNLTNEQLEFIKDANSNEIKLLIFLSCLKTYRFIYEFMHEVIRKKVMLFDYKIINSDYESFFESKQYAVEQLNNISENTQYKLKQVLFKILEEASIIDNTKNKNIMKPHLSNELIEIIVKDNHNYLAGFLLSDFEINSYKEKYL